VCEPTWPDAVGVSLAGLAGHGPITRLCQLGATVIGVATEIFDGQPLSLEQKIGQAGRWSRALPEARLCLDVAHAWTVDPSLRAGLEFLDAYPGRLAQLHVSGINPDGGHVPLTAGQVEAYAPLLRRCTQVPWIVESPPAG
jgi:hypothetical protein